MRVQLDQCVVYPAPLERGDMPIGRKNATLALQDTVTMQSEVTAKNQLDQLHLKMHPVHHHRCADRRHHYFHRQGYPKQRNRLDRSSSRNQNKTYQQTYCEFFNTK